MIIKDKIKITVVLAILPFFFCCGADEPNKNEVEDLSSKLEVERVKTSPVEIFPGKTLELADDRYVQEMIREEVDKAYAGTGEYIDPEKVISLVRGTEYKPVPEPTLNLDLPEEEQDKLLPVKTWRISQLTHEDAKKLFAEGDYPGAAKKWEGLTTDARVFTISIEVDCDTSLLKNSYEKLKDLEMPVFIQVEKVKGKTCYRLCAGIFAQMDESTPYMTKIIERLKNSFPFAMAFSR